MQKVHSTIFLFIAYRRVFGEDFFNHVLKEIGSLLDKKWPGRFKLGDDFVEKIRVSFLRSPKYSVRVECDKSTVYEYKK